MNQIAQANIKKCRQWLSENVFPLWAAKGIDPHNHAFVENFSFQGEPLPGSRRAMVQARQIYSFVTGAKMLVCPPEEVKNIVVAAARSLIQLYSLPSGAFVHAVDEQGKVVTADSELYTQAFVIFGMACAYEIDPNPEYRQVAKNLVAYLDRERAHSAGGYTELKSGKLCFQSNPHMHLFEAALAWLAIDKDPVWGALCEKLFNLCQGNFITEHGLAEHFDAQWKPETHDHKFLLEPGHHYEWAWLMAWYEELSGVQSFDLRHRLYELAEKNGISSLRRAENPEARFAGDELWSDFSMKKKSARFWPQGERVKAAVKLGVECDLEAQPRFAKAADEAMAALFCYLETPKQGLWYDQIMESGEWSSQVPKASSLYHIINAMDEYLRLRPRLQDDLQS